MGISQYGKGIIASLGAFVIRTTGRQVLAEEWNGNTFRFDATTAERFAMSWRYLSDGATSEGIDLELLQRPTTDVIIDVGAHYGMYSVVLGVLNPEAELHCFEPVQDNISVLEKNLRHNDIQAAVNMEVVAGESGETVFFESDRSQGHGTNQIFDSSRETTKEAVALSDYLSELSADTAFLKIDAEGAENEILRDILEHIDGVDIVALVEFHEDRLEESIDDLLAEIRNSGWTAEFVTNSTPDYEFDYPIYKITN